MGVEREWMMDVDEYLQRVVASAQAPRWSDARRVYGVMQCGHWWRSWGGESIQAGGRRVGWLRNGKVCMNHVRRRVVCR